MESTHTVPSLFVLPSFCSYMALCPPVVPARWWLLSHATENYCNAVSDARHANITAKKYVLAEEYYSKIIYFFSIIKKSLFILPLFIYQTNSIMRRTTLKSSMIIAYSCCI